MLASVYYYAYSWTDDEKPNMNMNIIREHSGVAVIEDAGQFFCVGLSRCDLIRAGQLLKIELLDHIIQGKASDTRPKDYTSLRELGYFYV